MPTTELMLLWHMHQPYYKDLVEDHYAMPWVRLHTLKDYYGMVAMIEEFPAVHMTFNMVPSLVSQILDYASGTAHEESYELAFKPVQSLTPEEKERLVKYAFQINHENLLSRYPRFWELFQKSKGFGSEPNAALISGVQELLDVQVLSQLAWFDEIYLVRDAEINALAARQRNYAEEDKKLLQAKETELCKVTLETYRKAADRGQIEISTSPFYHPILPLLCDTNAGSESSPGLRLPRQRFEHPEDAQDQLREAVKLHERVFGSRPHGLWPSEGSVSAEALRIASSEGFAWAATDEGVLGRSLRTYFHRHGDGTVQDGGRLYRPHRFLTGGQPVDLFFRDHHLSDLVGFVYSRMDPEDAARDFIHRVRSAARSTGGETAVVSVILDGENAWEYYPGNGREFLKRFYGLLSEQGDIQARTPSEILSRIEPAALPSLTPGSWINANFNVWIGAEEDNRAWDLLSDARNFFAENAAKVGYDSKQVEMARQELWIAEGSDWCWWYGPEHSTANDEEFDLLYRKHLGNLYRLLGGHAPDDLAIPIKRPRIDGYNIPPTALIQPVIDGRETTYFEWLGAGVYMPDERSAALHKSLQYIKEFFYGYSDTAVYLRLDLKNDFLKTQPNFEIHVNLGREGGAHLRAVVAAGSLDQAEFVSQNKKFSCLGGPADGIQIAFNQIFELSLSYALVGLAPQQKTDLQVSFWVNQLPVQILPREGWLNLELTSDLVTW